MTWDSEPLTLKTVFRRPKDSMTIKEATEKWYPGKASRNAIRRLIALGRVKAVQMDMPGPHGKVIFVLDQPKPEPAPPSGNPNPVGNKHQQEARARAKASTPQKKSGKPASKKES